MGNTGPEGREWCLLFLLVEHSNKSSGSLPKGCRARQVVQAFRCHISKWPQNAAGQEAAGSLLPMGITLHAITVLLLTWTDRGFVCASVISINRFFFFFFFFNLTNESAGEWTFTQERVVAVVVVGWGVHEEPLPNSRQSKTGIIYLRLNWLILTRIKHLSFQHLGQACLVRTHWL